MPWVKGQSGNVRGAPPKRNALAAAIRRETRNGEELVEFSLKVLRDETAPLIARQAEKQWLSDRGWGKAVETIVLEDERPPDVAPESIATDNLTTGLGPAGVIQ